MPPGASVFYRKPLRCRWDLYTLQDLLIGNPVYLDSNVVRYTRGAGIITLLSIGNLFKNAVTFSDADGTVLSSKLTDTDSLPCPQRRVAVQRL